MFADTMYLSSNWYYSGGQLKRVSGNGSASINIAGGNSDGNTYISFGTGTTGAASPTERARITSSGTLLVNYTGGTYNDPGFNGVQGIALRSTTDSLSVISASSTTPFYSYKFGGGVAFSFGYSPSVGTQGYGIANIEVDASNAYLKTVGAYNLIFGTNNSENARINSNGNFGIGTNSPSSKLHVATTTSETGVQITNNNATVYLGAVYSNGNFANGSIAGQGILRAGSGISFSANGGGSVHALLNYSGNLGLGVTPSSWDSISYTALQLPYGGCIAGYKGSAFPIVQVASNWYYDNGDKYVISAAASIYSQANGVHSWGVAGSGTAGATISFNTAMVLTNQGRLGVGTTSPNTKLHVSDPNGNNGHNGDNSGLVLAETTYAGSGASSNVSFVAKNYYGYSQFMQWENYGVRIGVRGVANSGQGNLVFTSGSDSEGMRLDGAGRLLVGASSFSNYGTLSTYTNTGYPSTRVVSGPSTPDGSIILMVDKYSSTNTTSQWFIGFTINNQSTASGVITANGASQAAFGAWSDRRLKENIVDLPPQLANIMALRPVEFDYIASEGGGHQISFIAQEFEQVYSDAVGERPDGMKTLTGWGKTEARLVKAIQEQQAIIESLKARLDAANL
jgi:hypothetical protein